MCPKESETDEEKKNDCYGGGASNKNWKLGKKCIEKMCRDYKLKGLLIGRGGCKMNKVCEGLLTTTGFLQQSELIKSYNQSTFILMSNQSNASPRVLTEALCCDFPVLVSYTIVVGGEYSTSPRTDWAGFTVVLCLRLARGLVVADVRRDFWGVSTCGGSQPREVETGAVLGVCTVGARQSVE